MRKSKNLGPLMCGSMWKNSTGARFKKIQPIAVDVLQVCGKKKVSLPASEAGSWSWASVAGTSLDAKFVSFCINVGHI